MGSAFLVVQQSVRRRSFAEIKKQIQLYCDGPVAGNR